MKQEQCLARIAKTPILIPKDVKLSLENNKITVTGKLGTLIKEFNSQVEIKQDGQFVTFIPTADNKFVKAVSGTIAAVIRNMFTGVTEGFQKKLILHGVGYKVNNIQSDSIELALGYSHQVKYKVKYQDVTLSATGNEITVKGLDKSLVGQVAADLVALRTPDPYKGKGLRYTDRNYILKEIKKH